MWVNADNGDGDDDDDNDDDGIDDAVDDDDCMCTMKKLKSNWRA